VVDEACESELAEVVAESEAAEAEHGASMVEEAAESELAEVTAESEVAESEVGGGCGICANGIPQTY
jgi:hypothetical protein